jgi:hypothetical protein
MQPATPSQRAAPWVLVQLALLLPIIVIPVFSTKE